MSKTAPVENEHSSDARNATSAATSGGCPTRPTGWRLVTSSMTSGLTFAQLPLAIVPDPRDATVHFVVQQAGRVRVVKNGVLQADDFLNLTSAVQCCDEQGLFSLVFPPIDFV